MLLGRCQNALEPYNYDIVKEVRLGLIGPTAHVLLLELDYRLADFRLNLSFAHCHIRFLPHPEAFAVRNTQNLTAMRAEINVALAQEALEFPHPDGTQLSRTMRTDRLDSIFDFQINHEPDYCRN